MLDRFVAHLSARGLHLESRQIVVAYSGGADSTCLLTLLVEAGLRVIAAHLHHGQRPEADAELEQCEAYANQLGVPFVGGRADVPRMSRELRIGTEEAGRLARQNFLGQVLRQTESDLIATGHTLSDHVETALFNFARGTGAAGLSGIPEVAGTVIRPLLGFTREETRAFCQARGLWFHDDPSNETIELSRARIRHRVLPELTAINPAAVEAMSRAMQLIGEESQFLDGAAAAALERAELRPNGPLHFLTKDCEVHLDRQVINGLPLVLARRALRLTVGVLGASLSFDQMKVVMDGLAGGPETSGSVTPAGGEVVVEWDPSRVVTRQLFATEPYRFKLEYPGEVESDQFGWRLRAIPHTGKFQASSRHDLSIIVDGAKFKGELYFRPVGDGDSMQPVGFEGTRKLKDMMSERKLTPAARARLPIVCDFSGPIWAPGVCFSRHIEGTNASQRLVLMTFEPIN